MVQENLIIPITTTNKLEQPTLKLNLNNQALNARNEELKHSIIGAKAGLINTVNA